MCVCVFDVSVVSVDEIVSHLNENYEEFYKIGRVVEGAGVKIRGEFFND